MSSQKKWSSASPLKPSSTNVHKSTTFPNIDLASIQTTSSSEWKASKPKNPNPSPRIILEKPKNYNSPVQNDLPMVHHVLGRTWSQPVKPLKNHKEYNILEYSPGERNRNARKPLNKTKSEPSSPDTSPRTPKRTPTQPPSPSSEPKLANFNYAKSGPPSPTSMRKTVSFTKSGGSIPERKVKKSGIPTKFLKRLSTVKKEIVANVPTCQIDYVMGDELKDETKNRVYWFLRNFPNVIIESAHNKKYLMVKQQKSSAVMKRYKIKDFEIQATFAYQNVFQVSLEKRESFSTKWRASEENDTVSKTSEDFDQISFYHKGIKAWTVDMDNIVRMRLNEENQQQLTHWFKIIFHGDMFSLQSVQSNRYIGINPENNQLICKETAINTTELFKLCVKAGIKAKNSDNYLTVKPLSERAKFKSSKALGEEALIFEIGRMSCRIYSHTNLAEDSTRRYLTCVEVMDNVWDIQFPLQDQSTSEQDGKGSPSTPTNSIHQGSLFEEEFQLDFRTGNYFSLKTFNGLFLTVEGKYLTLAKEFGDDCLFKLVPFGKNYQTLRKVGEESETNWLPTDLLNTLIASGNQLLSSGTLEGNNVNRKSTINEDLMKYQLLGDSTNSTNDLDSVVTNQERREKVRKSIFNIVKKTEKMEEAAKSELQQNLKYYVKQLLLYNESIIYEINDVIEILTNVQTSYLPQSQALPSSRCISGCLFITNFRLIFLPNKNEYLKSNQWCVQHGNIDTLLPYEIDHELYSSNSYFVFEIVGKHWLQIQSTYQKITQSNRLLAITSLSKQLGYPGQIINFINEIAFPLDFAGVSGLFAFKYFSNKVDEGWRVYDINKEFDRQYKNAVLHHGTSSVKLKWRISDVNSKYELCNTYPKLLVQPREISDSELKQMASHRSKGRIPSITWIHPQSGALLIRCSQPKQGFLSNKSKVEEKYFSQVCLSDLIWIMDARPQLNAVANRFKGAGYEDIEHYKELEYSVRIKFLGIANIHAMRDSLKRLRKLCHDDMIMNPLHDSSCSLLTSSNSLTSSTLLQNADTSFWLDFIRLLLKSSLRISSTLHDDTVIVHCSDGWDRTSQLCALSQIILDGYYRTIAGFCVLIEKDWITMGHKFASRCGNGDMNFKSKERSPIFLQFIDCVWQLLNQQPNFFQFNEWYLLAIIEHLFANQFGTFLFNNDQERFFYDLELKTSSLWTYLMNQASFVNPSYDPSSQQLFLDPSIDDVEIWHTLYYI